MRGLLGCLPQRAEEAFMRVKVIEIEGPEARFPPRASAVESELQVWSLLTSWIGENRRYSMKS
jgi:hypothetical protein